MRLAGFARRPSRRWSARAAKENRTPISGNVEVIRGSDSCTSAVVPCTFSAVSDPSPGASAPPRGVDKRLSVVVDDRAGWPGRNFRRATGSALSSLSAPSAPCVAAEIGRFRWARGENRRGKGQDKAVRAGPSCNVDGISLAAARISDRPVAIVPPSPMRAKFRDVPFGNRRSAATKRVAASVGSTAAWRWSGSCRP